MEEFCLLGKLLVLGSKDVTLQLILVQELNGLKFL